MWEKTAVPFLEGFTGGTLWSCELKHYGIGESALAEKFAHLLDLSNPTVAPYAGRGECRLRVTARGESQSAARALAQPIIAQIQAESGTLCYGKDKDLLESVVADLLIEKSLTLAAAESCTGGLISKRLTDIAGSSKFTSLNVVTYSNQAKTDILKVPEALLLEHGAVSSQCAAAMAQGVRRLSASSIGIGITGIAGPDGGSDEKPVGLVYIGLSGEGFLNVKELKCSPRLSRQEIRFRCANDALNMVRLYLLDANNLENQAPADDLRIDYRMTITRGIVPQFKRCQLVASEILPPQADELTELVRKSGILSVQKAFVQRAGNLVTWVLTVEDSQGSHQVSSHSGAQAEDEPALELEELLNFLNPFLDEWLP
jgi:PncC family amidohydrolase